MCRHSVHLCCVDLFPSLYLMVFVLFLPPPPYSYIGHLLNKVNHFIFCLVQTLKQRRSSVLSSTSTSVFTFNIIITIFFFLPRWLRLLLLEAHFDTMEDGLGTGCPFSVFFCNPSCLLQPRWIFTDIPMCLYIPNEAYN